MSETCKSSTLSPIFKYIVMSMLLTVCINNLYSYPLYAMGEQIIMNMQQHSNFVLDLMFVCVSLLIDPMAVVLAVLVLLVLSRQKRQALIFCVFLLLNIYLAALLKAYECDPRPFWSKTVIRVIGFTCPIDYGNPSGHSWFAAVAGFGTLQYFRAEVNYLNLCLCIVLCLLVPLSRMYLGAHSLDQVLYGLCMGLQMCALHMLGLKNLIEQFLTNFTRRKRCQAAAIICLILAIIPFLSAYNDKLPQQWIDQVSDKCSKVINQSGLNTLMLTINWLLVCTATGLACGHQQLAVSQHCSWFLQGNWAIDQQTRGKQTGYAAYLIIQCSCLLAPFIVVLVPSLILMSQEVTGLALAAAGFVAGYCYLAICPELLFRYRVLSECGREGLPKQN